MGNTTANTFSQKGANAVTEYKGYTIKRSNGRKGFTISPAAGEVPRILRGQWLKLEEAKHRIDGYLAQPEVAAANEKKVERSNRAKQTTVTTTEGDVDAKGDSK